MRLVKLFASVVAGFMLISVCSAQTVRNIKGHVQVFDVESSLPLVKNRFTYENDTIRITYYFWGNKGIMQIGINNKTDKPLYLDWKKSTFTVGDQVLSLAPEITVTTETKQVYQSYAFEGRFLHSIDYEMNYHSATNTQFETKVEDITEIRPYGYYMRLKYHLVPDMFFDMPEDAKLLSEPSSFKEGAMETVYEKTFSKADSPLKFSTSLVYFADKNEDSDNNGTETKADFNVAAAYELNAKHFRGARAGKDAEGRAIYKFPYRKSSRFYIEIPSNSALETRLSKKK
jgi:hypothetical protein